MCGSGCGVSAHGWVKMRMCGRGWVGGCVNGSSVGEWVNVSVWEWVWGVCAWMGENVYLWAWVDGWVGG